MPRVTTCSRYSGTPTKYQPGSTPLKVERLTGHECWRAMGRSWTGRVGRSGENCHRPIRDALVLLSVRDPEEWYRSASNTIFLTFDNMPPEVAPWMEEVRKLLRDRFSDRFDDPTAMIDAYIRHNDEVRAEVPASRLLEWNLGDGWDRDL